MKLPRGLLQLGYKVNILTESHLKDLEYYWWSFWHLIGCLRRDQGHTPIILPCVPEILIILSMALIFILYLPLSSENISHLPTWNGYFLFFPPNTYKINKHLAESSFSYAKELMILSFKC